jgi:hypothetical protein
MYIKYLPTGPSYSVGMLENDRKFNVLNPCSAQSMLILPLILMLPFIATLQLQKKTQQFKRFNIFLK